MTLAFTLKLFAFWIATSFAAGIGWSLGLMLVDWLRSQISR